MRRLFTILFTAITFVSLSFGQMVVKGDVVNVGNLRSDVPTIIKAGGTGETNGLITNNGGTLNLLGGITYTSNATNDGMLLNKYLEGSTVSFGTDPSVASKVRVAKTFKTGKDIAFSLPFNVRISDIRIAKGPNLTDLQPLTYGTDYAIWAYDIVKRAESGSPAGSSNWKTVTELEAGVGHLIRILKSKVDNADEVTIVFPAYYDEDKDNINLIYKTALHKDYQSHKLNQVKFYKGAAGETNWGWNFIGTGRTANYNPRSTNMPYEGPENDNLEYIGLIYIFDNETGYFIEKDIESLDRDIYLSPYAAFYTQVGGGEPATVESGTTGNIYYNHTGLDITPAHYKSSTNELINWVELRLQGDGSTFSDRLIVKKSDSYTNKYSLGEDGPKMLKNSVPAEFYTLLENIPMAINKYQTIDNDIPVGLRVSEAGTYTISLANLNGFDDTDIYVIDKEANKVQNLLEGDYVFNASTTADDRLFLRFGSVTGIQTPTSKISVRVENNTAYVKNIKVGDQVSIYNIAGQMISRGIATSSEQSYPLTGTGVYVVKVTGSESYISKVINK
ncbi:MAG: T9SS type A sorting domain-containing protein [Prevotella sp.]|jgi:hypothetical protein|nr:T9SS type A sorting domain-containing protein [Prevotella sp.]